MLESFAWIVCKVLWLQWTKHERSVSFFLYSFLIKLTLQGYRQCKLSSLLYFVVSLSAGLSDLRLLYVVLVVQVVFPISARRLSNDGQLFLKKHPQKLFFVVSLSAGLYHAQRVVPAKHSYTLYLLFKLFFLYQQETAARTGCFS